MKNLKYIHIVLAAVLLFSLPVMTGCNDDEPESPRLFKPRTLTAEPYYDGFTATWVGSEGAEGYRIEVSQTETFDQIEKSIDTDARTRTLQVTGLSENTLYYIRLCGTMSNTALNSKYKFVQVTTGTAYSIFLPVDESKLSFTGAEMTWRDKVNADKVIIEKTTGTPETKEQILTSENIENQSIRISGLSEGNTYKVTLYKGSESLGYTRFTLPSKPEGTVVIDANNASTLQSIIDGSASGATIMFTGGQTFDYTGNYLYLRKDITLMGEPGTSKPKLYVKGILISGESKYTTINEINLQRIDFSGFVLSGTTEKPGDEPAAQLIGVEMSTTTDILLSKLKVEDCIIRNFSNSFLELNTGVTSSSQRVRINEINVNNSLVYDLGRNKTNFPSFISITNKDSKNCFCAKYVIRNSTFHHLMRGLIEARIFATIDDYSNPAVILENCTFDSFGSDKAMINGNWLGTNTEMTKNFLDFKASGVSVSIKPTITNCLFGEMATVKLTNKFVQGVTLTSENSYMLTLSKRVFSGDSTVNPLEDFSGTADELFPDRDKYDYSIAASAGIENTGDPRWNK